MQHQLNRLVIIYIYLLQNFLIKLWKILHFIRFPVFFNFLGDWRRFCWWSWSSRKKKFWALEFPLSPSRRYPSIWQVRVNKVQNFFTNQRLLSWSIILNFNSLIVFRLIVFFSSKNFRCFIVLGETQNFSIPCWLFQVASTDLESKFNT